jgi:putative endopeptidase
MTRVATPGPVGVELADRHPDIHPGDDLYRHMNERWAERHPIPADKARFGAFTVLAENAEAQVRAIAEAAVDATEGSEEHKVGALYRSFMDEDAIEKRGLEPLLERLHDLHDHASSPDDLLVWMGGAERRGLSGLVQLFIDNDPGSPDRYIVFMEQDGLTLPDESYYRDDQFRDIRDALVAHMEKVFTFVGLSTPAERAQAVLEFETKLASHHWDQVKCRDANATYNLRTWSDVTTLAGGFDLERWAGAVGVSPEALAEVVVRQPDFVSGLGEVWAEAPVNEIEAWLSWRLIIQFAPYLTKAMVDLHFDFFGRTLTGTPELRARWKRGVGFVEGVMGEAVGKLFVAKHFPPESKKQMDELVANLLEAYRVSIQSLRWMSDETKKRALDKLDTFVPKIGYPDTWRDYSALTASESDVIANVEASAEFEFQRELAKIGRPIDRAEWFMTPQTVNAYYNPGFNEIVFPAAILQYPFFDPERDAAANYGAIGAVIGHEIGHGFDDQGSRYDGDGRLTDWWTAEDRERFENLTKVLIDQFSVLEPRQLPGQKVNGELTIGENIGDLGGLAIAWKAYLASLGGSKPAVIDGVSAAERFFLSWAQSWRFKVRDEEAKRLLQIDPHSPAEFRCNQIARNLDLFYEAFEVSPEHELWLEPDRRVSIW